MVADSVQRRPVGLCEDRLHFHRLQITRGGNRRALKRDGKDFGTLRDQRWFLPRHEVEEATDRGEPAVSCADRALAFVLGMAEERADLTGGEITQGDQRDLAAFPFRDEPEKQPPSVAI